jgi:site-specific DNA-adenine methylase
MQYAKSCNDEKSHRALAKTCSESPKRVLVFLETNHELEGKEIEKYVGREA